MTYYYINNYYLNILAKYIIDLSNIHLQQSNYCKYLIENEKLRNENKNYYNEISVLKRKLEDYEYENNNKKICCESKKINQYNIIKYNIGPFSWSNEKINKTLSSIKSIDDIIKLNKYWIKIRHNVILQRLYHLIPALIKLNDMIGLNKIKKDIFKQIIYYSKNLFKDEYLHTVITGPPGVGKTEFAKIYADIFVRLGILKSDKFIEIKRDDLVGEYLGQTSVKTRKLLESAMDGVLFLDEAYSLGNQEKRDSFSKEAIDMLNVFLSEKKDSFMFIIAGYEDEIEDCLFAYNRGLKRRFQSYYNIEGYKPLELKEIFIKKVKNSNYNLSISDDIINKFFLSKHDFPNYGGDIEKLFNEIKQIQALRIFHDNINNKNIIIEDIELAYNNLFTKKKIIEPYISMYI